MSLPGDFTLKIFPLIGKVIEQRPNLKFSFEKNINFTNEYKITVATFKDREDVTNRISNILIKASVEMTNLKRAKKRSYL